MFWVTAKTEQVTCHFCVCFELSCYQNVINQMKQNKIDMNQI